MSRGVEPPLLTPEQLIELEKCATGLLRDDEIMVSLDITSEQLARHYNVVEKARIHIKQKLNEKNIIAAAKGEIKAQDVVDSIPRNNGSISRYRPSKGGYRNGAGRPHGSNQRITAKDILKTFEDKTGMTFAEALVEGYMESIFSGDRQLRFKYEQLIGSKVIADKKVEIDPLSSEEIENQIQRLLENNVVTVDTVTNMTVDLKND